MKTMEMTEKEIDDIVAQMMLELRINANLQQLVKLAVIRGCELGIANAKEIIMKD